MSKPNSLRADLSKGWRYAFARRRKLVVYVAEGLTQVGSMVTLTGPEQHYVQMGLLALGLFGIHAVPNADPVP